MTALRPVGEPVEPKGPVSENPADLDRTDPEGEIAARAEAFRNWAVGVRSMCSAP